MPFGDGTGPRGMGPMTGRGAGYCAGYGAPGFTNPYPRGGRAGRFFGRGVPYADPYAGGYADPYAGPYGPDVPYGAYGQPYYGWGPGYGQGRGFGMGRGFGFGRGRGFGRGFGRGMGRYW